MSAAANTRKARIITIAILAIALALVIGKRTGWTPTLRAKPASSTPQDVIYAMLDAAREGNTQKYLASYTGQMETSLKQAIAESSDFGKYLKDSNAAIKGVAIMEPQQLTDREIKARVEYVFQDRNEVQYMYLEKMPGGWRISRIDSAERIKTLVPYGTPVR